MNVKDAVSENGSILMVVPAWYNHTSAIADVKRKADTTIDPWDRNFSDANFADSSVILMPGQSFTVRKFEVKPFRTIVMDDAIKFATENGGVLAGVRGLALVYSQHRSFISQRETGCMKSYVSLEVKDKLYKIGDYILPCIYSYSSVESLDISVCMGYMSGLSSSDIILCFYPE